MDESLDSKRRHGAKAEGPGCCVPTAGPGPASSIRGAGGIKEGGS